MESAWKIITATLCAAASYLIGGLNPAIILSRAIYRSDVRDSGSGNAGFSNFKRVYGGKFAWLVFVLDLGKGIALPLLSGLFFRLAGMDRIDGVWISGVFCIIGHAYPVWYRFKGGKSVLTCLALAFIIDWRAGLVAFSLMALLLLTVKIMSVSTLSGLLAAAVLIWFLCPSIAARIAFSCCVIFVWIRHRGNIVRLMRGEERKFSIR